MHSETVTRTNVTPVMLSKTDVVWRLSHPALSASMHIDPKNPGQLSPTDTAIYSEAMDMTEGTLANYIIEALISERGVSRKQSEWIMDAWDMQTMGQVPNKELAPIPNA